MKDFVNNVLTELRSNSDLSKDTLVNLVIESTNKSIMSNDSYDMIYNQLKTGLTGVNEHLKNKDLDVILGQFSKNENTTDSALYEMSRIADLKSKLMSIRESNAVSNPVIASLVDSYMDELSTGTPEFKVYPSFVSQFSQHSQETSVKEAVKSVKAIVEKNAHDLEVLNTIHTMVQMQAPMYEGAINGLKEMLAEGSYTADVINLKYGSTNLPIINNLVSALKISESKESGDFTMGMGNANTKVKNLIAPAIKLDENVMLMYSDNKFMRISESKELNGSEAAVHINTDEFTIATINPDYIKENHSDFYKVSEAYAKLGFINSTISEGVETSLIKNFKLGMTVNESKNLDFYINDAKIEDIKSINLTEALVMQSSEMRECVELILENTEKIFNFEFIKDLSNERMMAESSIYKLGENFFLCEKVNTVERNWTKVDEHEMYEFYLGKYNYDISPIFKTKIDESIVLRNKIEERKVTILQNVSKLEESVNKLNTTIDSKDVSRDNIPRLESLKESIQSSIFKLKEEYINIDLAKKEITEESLKEGKLNPGLQAYLDKKKGKDTDSDDGKEDDKSDDKKDDDKKEDDKSDEVNESINEGFEYNLASRYARPTK